VGIAARITFWLTLLWSNPPDLDLAYITLHAVRANAPADTFRWSYHGICNNCEAPTFPAYPGTPPFDLWLSPGATDSIHVALPCYAVPRNTWRFWITATDTTGRNTSEPSNVVEWWGP
jgi:hypothetical protein